MTLSPADFRSPPVYLFFDGYDLKAVDGPFGQIRSRTRAALRYGYRTAKRTQPYTGFYTAFRNLARSLRQVGCDVRVNDFAGARAEPARPIGLAGFPSVFEAVRLDNPALFGPGEVPPPAAIEAILAQANIRIATQPSSWACRIYEQRLGDRIQPLFVGIDTEAWPDLSSGAKDLDVLVYDKIRWNRDERRADLLEPFLAMLARRSLSVEVLRYGHHHLGQFRRGLRRARALAFLTEHETQGLAYQEAMSSGVPVLAWNEGMLVDPLILAIKPPGLVVSSVPYFDDRCGVTFRTAEMEERFELFWSGLSRFRPRDYILDTLSLRHGARRYLDLLARVGT